MWIEFVLLVGALIALLVAGMWVPFAIGICGLAILYYEGGTMAMRALGLVSWGSMTSFTLTSIPLFIFMAEILGQSGVGKRFYDGMSVLVRKLPGGLLQTNIMGSALFAAICGSSVATAASIGSIALPHLKERQYDQKLSCGSLAAGGTLGILIPPSITMIIYGTLSETSISKLFMAGLVPGIVLASLYVLYISVRTLLNPNLVPKHVEPASRREVLAAITSLAPLTGLILIVLGGIYLGYSTPTEAAAVGSMLSLIIAISWRELTLERLKNAVVSTVNVSCTLLFIILAAIIFSYGIELGGVGHTLVEGVTNLSLNRFEFLLVLIAVYLVLGCFLDGAGMIVLTVPLLLPVIHAMQIDPIWFGVFVVLMLEMGMLSPPFGLNLFVVQGVSGWSFPTVVFGTIPFLVILVAFAVLMIAFPQMALWLPAQL
ncbi:MAG: TRAP transporter large permease [Nitratireductor sp.]|nr:TRAP transporter large permease [Nitratireductor sp.]